MNSLEDVDGKAIRKAIDVLDRYERERRYLVKRSEELGALEEVFDKATLMTLHSMMNTGTLAYLNGVLKAGKESRVYWGVTREDTDVAVKIYLTLTAEFRKRMQYIRGDHRFKQRHKGTLKMVEIWAQKEFRNLQSAYRHGIEVPKPIEIKRNVLIMEFIGTDGKSSPVLSQVDVNKMDYRRLISIIRRFYRGPKLVHADLSEYNIFKTNSGLILFDLGSAVDISHPMAQNFLIRDFNNVNRFFSRRGVHVDRIEELFKRVTGNEFQTVRQSLI